ncbi:MAG: helix-turn-helix domain-containing protein [Streptosporangiales bacterium]|nr:helix-turn-helix domain-containing protein [Streptosporangiales bacterium]
MTAPPDPPARRDSEVVRLDAKGLRALAHPVRVRLLGLLRKHGPATATRLAERLRLNSGATSYHLRQLAAAGFVEEDTERGNARERWWRSVHQTTIFDVDELAERDPEAAFAYLRSVLNAHALRSRRGVDDYLTMPAAWRPLLDLSDWGLRLTPDEARGLFHDLDSVVDRYRRDTGPEDAPVDAAPVSLIIHLLPDLETTEVMGLEAGS